MLAFIIRRIGQSILVLLVVGLVAFSMFRFVGDPIDNLLGQERTMEDVERLRAQVRNGASRFLPPRVEPRWMRNCIPNATAEMEIASCTGVR